MEILNIGIPELIVILVIALIVLGPDGIVKTARNLGKTIRKVIRSPIWSMMLDTQRELREMPTKLVREAGLEEDLAELRKTSREVQQATRDIAQSNSPGTLPRITPNPGLPLEDKSVLDGSALEETIMPPDLVNKSPDQTEEASQENPPTDNSASPDNN